MKTNVVMTSQDRVLFGVQIRQETQTSFLNLSDLQDAYDSVRVKEGWSAKRIDHVTQTDSFVERCYYLLEKQGVFDVNTNPLFKGFIEQVENQGITNVLKSYGAWKTTGARHTKTTWCNPYIWVMIAMEMNPKLYAEVVMWLTDRLILNRIEAGSFYVELTNELRDKFKDPNYAVIAIEINKVVFGRHELGIRQLATEKQLNKLKEFEKILAFSLKNNLVKTEKELITLIQKQSTNN